jgi:nitrogen fixation/metabolism regulation signal transduction histidine kinase
MELVGTLGPWDRVAETGRQLFDAAAPAMARDSTLARAVEQHQRELSGSLTQARRWSFLGARAAAALPWVLLAIAILLAGISLWISRRIARELARPIQELVGWAALMGRGEELPAAAPRRRDVREVQVLRDALRHASGEIAGAQSRKLESERVRAWGEMARRIAHEMKNPLTPLRLAVHRLELGVPQSAELRESMEVIAEETTRLDELAKQFALLGRPSSGPRSEIDIAELVSGLMSSDVPAEVETAVDVDAGVPLLFGHHDALQRAVRNLVRNAVEAIESSQDKAAGSGHPRITSRIRETRGGVSIEIADTGGGIPEDRLERIFEPDYTLKAGGTGLGLALVRQAVAAHEGTVTARNADGGAVFEIWLPAAEVSQ